MPTQTVSNDLEVKFASAVGLVRSLPQKGPFQPSYNDASKVYGYYKQAKCGPCKNSRPAFWDVVGRAKWDAWNVLGNMPKQEAMENYVHEIKKLFERLTKTEDFKEAQKTFSEAIIPFCESTGLEIPGAVAEIRKHEKKLEEKKKIKGFEKPEKNVTNRQILQEGNRHKDMLIETDNGDINVVQLVNNGPQNGDFEHDEAENGDLQQSDESGLISFSIGSLNYDDENNVPPQAVQMETSSFVDAESSDDDIYCDSVNPDQISGLKMDMKEEESASILVESQLTNVTEDHLLSSKDSQFEVDDSDIIARHQSTPAVKIRSLGACTNGQQGHEIALKGSSINNHTDTSTLSSLSADLNSIHVPEASKSRELEEELKHEFEAKCLKNSHRGKTSRDRHRDLRVTSRAGSKHHIDGLGRRDLVVGARGNSQTDLTRSGAGSREGKEETRAQQPIAEASRPGGEQVAPRLRRSKADSSSDSNDSTRSSTTSGETIGEQIVKALGRLEHDMRLVLLRLDSIDNRICTVSEAVNRRPWWAAFLPSRRLLFLLMWPVFINIIFLYWRRKRRK